MYEVDYDLETVTNMTTLNCTPSVVCGTTSASTACLSHQASPLPRIPIHQLESRSESLPQCCPGSIETLPLPTTIAHIAECLRPSYFAQHQQRSRHAFFVDADLRSKTASHVHCLLLRFRPAKFQTQDVLARFSATTRPE